MQSFVFTIIALASVTFCVNAGPAANARSLTRTTSSVRLSIGESNLSFLDQLDALDILERLYDRLNDDAIRAKALAQSYQLRLDECRWNVVAGTIAVHIADTSYGYLKIHVTPIVDPNLSPESGMVPEEIANNFYLFSSAQPGKVCAF